MKNPVFTGSSVAIVTPFKDGKTDFKKLSELVEFHLNNGTNSITICGTTGEASTQTTEDHLDTIDRCVKMVNGRVPVVAGVGSNDTGHALEMALSAEQSGADALLIVTPYYNKTSQHGLVQHYTYIADRVKTPIIMYNVPGRTGMTFKTDTYVELSKHPLINGVKEASGDFDAIATMMQACGDDMNVWSGNDSQITPILALGGKGVISVLANIVPRETADICKLFFENKPQEAASLQVRLMELINALFIEVNPVPVKTALNLMGMDVGPLRMPLFDMLPKNLEVLKKAMANWGLSTAG
ncbi:4-hydroxy-tetrahydrodipicolinate synthase [Oscillospiraceae bacterium OttesenSCG-928-G22]|nr:4-hydroxy-tetrahydrodipicolinate synthase [Oscillospiraceae bacterium OttesenSCG-928-G22]